MRILFERWKAGISMQRLKGLTIQIGDRFRHNLLQGEPVFRDYTGAKVMPSFQEPRSFAAGFVQFTRRSVARVGPSRGSAASWIDPRERMPKITFMLFSLESLNWKV